MTTYSTKHKPRFEKEDDQFLDTSERKTVIPPRNIQDNTSSHFSLSQEVYKPENHFQTSYGDYKKFGGKEYVLSKKAKEKKKALKVELTNHTFRFDDKNPERFHTVNYTSFLPPKEDVLVENKKNVIIHSDVNNRSSIFRGELTEKFENSMYRDDFVKPDFSNIKDVLRKRKEIKHNMRKTHFNVGNEEKSEEKTHYTENFSPKKPLNTASERKGDEDDKGHQHASVYTTELSSTFLKAPETEKTHLQMKQDQENTGKTAVSMRNYLKQSNLVLNDDQKSRFVTEYSNHFKEVKFV